MPTIPSRAVTLQNAAGATGNGNILDVTNYTTAVFNITISASATLTFEVTNDYTNWSSLSAVQEGTNATSATATATGLYRANISGYRGVRARVSTFGSGTITVVGRATFDKVSGSGSGGGTGTGAGQVQGTGASGATAVGNPVAIGGKFNTTPPTLTDGQRGDIQLDNKGNQLVTLSTLIAGEDLTNNKMVTESRYSFTNVTTNTTTTIKSGSGVLFGIVVNNPSAITISVLTLTLYDNTAASGTKIGTLVVPLTTTGEPFTILESAVFTTGLTAVTAGPTTAADLTFIYR